MIQAMRARIIETGEIVVVKYEYFNYTKCIAIYSEVNGNRTWNAYELEFGIEMPKSIDWEQRRFELAKSAVQGLMANTQEDVVKANDKLIATWAINLADAVIEKLKEA